MFTFLRNLLGRPERSGKSAAARRRQGTTLQLEALEDRLTPSSYAASLGYTSGGAVASWGFSNPFVVSGNSLYVYGTSGNDSFDFTAGTSSNTVTLNGTSFTVNPAQIHNIYFYGQGGTDKAMLTDRVGQANAVFNPHSASMSGSNYYVSVNNTTYNYAFGRIGDTASFYDSPGSDIFVAGQNSGAMYDSGITYLNSATGFTYNNGYSFQGGTDTARFYDSAGNDIYITGKNYARMFDGGTYYNNATGFAITHAYSSQGGTDTAFLHDTDARGSYAGGVFVGNQSDANLFGGGYDNTATGFSDVEAYSTAYDYYTLYNIDYTLHFHGNWEQD
jgi:hypothetical protein